MTATETSSSIEVAQIADLLGELSQVQTELLDLLQEKQRRIATKNPAELAELLPREQELAMRMHACQERRTALLEQARCEGLPGDSLAMLANTVEGTRGPLAREVKESAARMRLLQHHSLVNFVLAQKALLHVAQLLEIIATGGRMQPTYGSGSSQLARGNLINSEA